MTIPHFPSKCTHTAVNTHTAVGSHLCCGARGSSWGSAPCSREPHRGIERRKSTVPSLPPPTIPDKPRLELSTFGLRVGLTTIRPRLPQNFQCCGNSLPFLVISGRPDIWIFGLSCAVQKYVIQNCEWFTLKTQMVLAGSFLCFPTTHSPSLLIWLWYFSSVPAKEPNNTFPVPVLTGFGTVRTVYGPERNFYFRAALNIWEEAGKINQDRTPSSFPSENPLSNARHTWFNHNQIV